MKTNKHIISMVIAVAVLSILWAATTLAQDKPGLLSKIIIYKGDVPGTGPGLSVLRMTVGEEVTVTAKGVDEKGNDVPIWPTWKADKELSIRVVEGRSKTAVVKALKEGGAFFFEAVYITDEGKKVTGSVAVEVKAKK